MEPNLTIFIQVFNFFIGFILIKNLLLKPAVKYLQTEEVKKDNLSKDISNQKKLLEQKIETKKETWKTYQEHFSKTCPKPVDKEVFALQKERKEPEVPQIPEDKIEQLSQQIEKALVERVEHVRE